MTRFSSRTAAAAMWTAAALVTTACGSTVSTGAIGPGGAGSDLSGLSSTAPETLASSPLQGLSNAPGSTSQPTAGAGPETTTTPTGEGTNTSGHSGSTTRATPSIGTPLTIGVITSGNTGAYASNFGINANYGDQRKQAQLIGDYLNKHGGLLGHKLTFTFYDYNAGSSAPTNAQSACSAFTQDHHAFAAIGVAGMDESYYECAAKAGMLVLTEAAHQDTAFYRRYPTSIVISDLELARKYHGMVLGLNQQGFFTKGAKIAILAIDDAGDRAGVQKGMIPALKSIGLTATDVTYVSQDSNSTSEYSAAVLKYRSDGITHVLFGYGGALVFGLQAQEQGYYPMQGIDSRQSPGLFLQSTLSPNELANIWGVGYQPVQDTDARNDPGPVSSRQTLCKETLDAGRQGWGSTRLAMATALYLCDELYFLQDAYLRAPDLSHASFLNGITALGSTYQSTLTFTTRFSATRHDGAQSWRPLRYERDCKCFKYTGPARPFE